MCSIWKSSRGGRKGFLLLRGLMVSQLTRSSPIWVWQCLPVRPLTRVVMLLETALPTLPAQDSPRPRRQA